MITKYYIFFYAEGKLIKHGESFFNYYEAKDWLEEKITEGVGQFDVYREWTIIELFTEAK